MVAMRVAFLPWIIKPVMGNEKLQYSYEGSIYYFASQEHLDIFKGNPEKYKPQFMPAYVCRFIEGRVCPLT